MDGWSLDAASRYTKMDGFKRGRQKFRGPNILRSRALLNSTKVKDRRSKGHGPGSIFVWNSSQICEPVAEYCRDRAPAIAHTSSNLLLISCPAEDRRPSWPENAVGYGNLLKVACDRRPGGIGPMCVCVCVCVCVDNNF